MAVPMESLRDGLAAVYHWTDFILRQPPRNYNPQEIRYRTLLEEQRKTAARALVLLRRSPLPSNDLREALSVMFRDDETADPVFRSWVRVSLWMKSAEPDDLQNLQTVMERIRGQLEELVPAIVQLYGDEETRLIVPAIYRQQERPPEEQNQAFGGDGNALENGTNGS